jgi:hypothetical protein
MDIVVSDCGLVGESGEMFQARESVRVRFCSIDLFVMMSVRS